MTNPIFTASTVLIVAVTLLFLLAVATAVLCVVLGSHHHDEALDILVGSRWADGTSGHRRLRSRYDDDLYEDEVTRAWEDEECWEDDE